MSYKSTTMTKTKENTPSSWRPQCSSSIWGTSVEPLVREKRSRFLLSLKSLASMICIGFLPPLWTKEGVLHSGSFNFSLFFQLSNQQKNNLDKRSTESWPNRFLQASPKSALPFNVIVKEVRIKGCLNKARNPSCVYSKKQTPVSFQTNQVDWYSTEKQKNIRIQRILCVSVKNRYPQLTRYKAR